MDGYTVKRKASVNDDGKKRSRVDSVIKSDGTIIVGTRKSKLAVIQTNIVIEKLKHFFPEISFKIQTMETLGDKILNVALPKIGEKSLFTKDLEIALANGNVEFLVHSLKDLPTKLPTGMAIGTIIERDSPYDCVIVHPKHKGKLLADLPKDSIIGTSSLRRIAQLMRHYSHLKFQNVRGNLITRLKKLEEENLYDALILAKAGVDRMGWTDKIGQILTEECCLYAIGQGAIAVEIRNDDKFIQNMICPLTHIDTLLSCACERAFMRRLNGGCSTPVACSSKIENGELLIRGVVLSMDGKTCLDATVKTSININYHKRESERSYSTSQSGLLVDTLHLNDLLLAEKLGEKLATDLISLGAGEILAEVRANVPKVMDIQIPKQDK